MKSGQTPYFSFAFGLLCAFAAQASDGLWSAADTARELHRHLAEGNLEEAAALSNAPKRRFQVLSDYRARVGEEEFGRVFSAYLNPQNQLVSEIAIGRHRLLIWRLAGLDRLAGEFFVEVDGRLLLDDVPSATRDELRRILRAHRAKDAENRGQGPNSPAADAPPVPSFSD